MAIKNKKENQRIERICCTCGKIKSFNSCSSTRSDFYISSSPAYIAFGHMPFCKSCCLNLFKQYLVKFGNDVKKAIYTYCRITNTLFTETLYEASMGKIVAEQPDPEIFFGLYMKNVNSLKQFKNKTFDDSDFLYSSDNVKASLVFNKDFQLTEDIMKRWSTAGFSEDDYKFLEREYEDFKDSIDEDDKIRQMFVRDICIARLEATKARIDKRYTDMKNLQNHANTLMVNGNFNPSKNDDIKSLFHGQWIKHIENDMPITEPEKEFKDVNTIRKLIEVHFTKQVARMLDFITSKKK